jgi:NDP-sugar pyrophosphorylase family protein
VQAVVLAAGEGRRMRPVSERWPKPVLPIDGRPVVASLLRELAAARLTEVTVVIGHLADQVEDLLGDGSAFGVNLRYARQPRPDGSADALRRGVEAGARPPFVVSAADTLFASGDVGRFAESFLSSGNASALAFAPDGSPAPLWGLTGDVLLEDLPGPPFELLDAVRRAGEVARVEIGKTRGVTNPLDLVRENFPYLR